MIEEMFTIRPVPRSIMCSSAGWDMKNAPERLTPITLYQSSSVIFSTVLSLGDAGVVDEDVQAAVLLDHLVDVRRQSSGVADVALVDRALESASDRSAWNSSAASRSRL